MEERESASKLMLPAGSPGTSMCGWSSLLLAVSFVLILFHATTVPAQRTVRWNQGGVPIEDATKAAIIDSASKALNDVYVFPDVAEQMEKKLHANLRAKIYREIDTYEAFRLG